MFLGGFALIGIVLRGENAVSDFVSGEAPNGVSIGFIDPTYALVGIALIRVSAAYRIVRLFFS